MAISARRSIALMTFFAAVFEHAGGLDSGSTYLFMKIDNVRTGQSIEVCANFYPRSKIGSKRAAVSPAAANPYRLKYYVSREGVPDDTFCTELSPNTSFKGEIVQSFLQFSDWEKASGGHCYVPQPISGRIQRLQNYNADAALFMTYPFKTHAGFYDPLINGSDTNIPIYFMGDEAYGVFQKFVDRSHASDYELRFYLPKALAVDGGMVIILFIAMICIILGGLWSGHMHYAIFLGEVERKSRRQRRNSGHSHTAVEPVDASSTNPEAVQHGASVKSQDNDTDHEPAATPLTWLSLVIFVAMIVAFLLLLYFVYWLFVWVVIVMYVFASSCAMCDCLWFFVQKIPYGKWSFRLDPLADFLCRICSCACCKWKCLRCTIEYRHALLYMACATYAILWCVFRHWSYSFILHDILATFFSIVLIRNLRIANLKWITFLLSALLIYDLFMVFITPYMTSSGCSVMIDVATGGACSRNTDQDVDTSNLPPNASAQKEELPTVIRVPRLGDPALSCFRMDVDLQYPPIILGLGDIILPGVLVGYNMAFSLAWRTPYKLYYIVAVVGYFFGMICTFVALILSKAAQPALIYLVPFTVVPTHITAVLRKEWRKMWKGRFPVPAEAVPILKDKELNADGSETASATDTANGALLSEPVTSTAIQAN